MPVLPRRSTAEEWIWSTTACVIMIEPACNTRTARTQSLPAWFMNAAGSMLLTVAVGRDQRRRKYGQDAQPISGAHGPHERDDQDAGVRRGGRRGGRPAQNPRNSLGADRRHFRQGQ